MFYCWLRMIIIVTRESHIIRVEMDCNYKIYKVFTPSLLASDFFFLQFSGIPFQLFKLLCLDKDHRWGLSPQHSWNANWMSGHNMWEAFPRRCNEMIMLIRSYLLEAKQKYRVFETQKSGNKRSSGEISLNIRTLASPKTRCPEE